MSIPDLTEEGFLPAGIYDCTLDEVESVFGRFQKSERRVQLAKNLREFVAELINAKIGNWLLIDGSYVTIKEEPGDIDIVLVLPEDFDLSAELTPTEYNLISNRVVKRKYDFHLFITLENSGEYVDIVDFFQRVMQRPDLRKGLLRLALC